MQISPATLAALALAATAVQAASHPAHHLRANIRQQQQQRLRRARQLALHLSPSPGHITWQGDVSPVGTECTDAAVAATACCRSAAGAALMEYSATGFGADEDVLNNCYLYNEGEIFYYSTSDGDEGQSTSVFSNADQSAHAIYQMDNVDDGDVYDVWAVRAFDADGYGVYPSCVFLGDYKDDTQIGTPMYPTPATIPADAEWYCFLSEDSDAVMNPDAVTFGCGCGGDTVPPTDAPIDGEATLEACIAQCIPFCTTLFGA